MSLDALDLKILDQLQKDCKQPLETLAEKVGSSKSPVWNRIKRMREGGIIKREIAVLDAKALGQGETFFIQIQTDQHEAAWLDRFTDIILSMPEIQEAHRLAGQIDYLLKVRVGSTSAFDDFYKRFVSQISMFNVNSSLSMESIKETSAIKLDIGLA